MFAEKTLLNKCASRRRASIFILCMVGIFVFMALHKSDSSSESSILSTLSPDTKTERQCPSCPACPPQRTCPQDAVAKPPVILPEFAGASPALEEKVSRMVSQRDFSNPTFIDYLKALAEDYKNVDRKQWEYGFIAYHINQHGACKPGKRGLVFAAGQERMVSYFANLGCDIVATDLHRDDAASGAWANTAQHSTDAVSGLYYAEIMADKAAYEKRVSFKPLNMNFLPSATEELGGKFDFIWSTCSIEHVGSISLGQRVVLNSLQLLKPGGIAVHTVEFNVASLTTTTEERMTSIWRKSDMERLSQDVERLGYQMYPLRWEAGDMQFDLNPDEPPYVNPPLRNANHLKLFLYGYISTSYAFVIVKPLDHKF